MLPLHKTRLSVFNYDEIPEGYYFKAMESGGAVQRFWHREKFGEVAARVREGESVLDVGCGPGGFLSILGRTLARFRAVGVDIASKQIEFATRHVSRAEPGRQISFETLAPGRITLPYPDASFDVVTCIEVIEHLHPFIAMRILKEAKRVLKPEGRLYLTTPNYLSLWPLIELLMERLSPVRYHDQHVNRYSPSSLVKFLETAGYEVVDVRTIFLAAPFMAALSPRVARWLHTLERKLGWNLGSLIVVEARQIDWDSAYRGAFEGEAAARKAA